MDHFARFSHMAAGLLIATLALPEGAQSSIPVDSTDQGTRVRHICETVLRVSPGDAAFDACISGLLDSLNVGRHDAAAHPIPIADDPDAGRSYYAVSNGARFHREQLVCAQLGFDAGAFTSCVMNLSGTLQAVDHPMG
jgi:hypothetical protein